MSSNTAIIICKKCNKILATINAYHEPKSNWFVPQDITMEEYSISSRFCQNCLNKPDIGVAGEKKEEMRND